MSDPFFIIPDSSVEFSEGPWEVPTFCVAGVRNAGFERIPPTIINQVPAPSATNVSVGSTIAFTLMDESEGVKLLPTIIRVNTGAGFVTVYQFAGFVNGWSGTVVPNGLGYNFVLVKPTPFPILQAVQVRVETYDQAPVPNKLDVTYSFTTENLELDVGTVTAGNNGYGPVDMTGNIPVGVYRIHVGPLGNASDPQAYNGTPGSGGDDVEFVEVSLSKTAPARGVYFPPLPIGGPYNITLVGSSTLTLPAAVVVVAHATPSKMLGLRGTLPRQYATGPRSLVQTRYPQE